MTDYTAKYNQYLTVFNDYLNKTFDNLDINAPKTIKDAMAYAVKDGGKRVRPILCMATAEMLGVNFDKIKDICIALECIHSYSLVHDDLPAMDNDDYRRGKLSTHKKFGEANGILAGDALLNFAFEIVLSKENFTINDAKALKILAEFAGYSGMIAGQILDLENEKNCSNEKVLYNIYENKTAKLITAPLLIASIYADQKNFEHLKLYGYNLGVLFQIIDDVMDVEGTLESIGKTPHKDLSVDKLTSVKVFGFDGALKKAEFHYNECKKILAEINADEFLHQLTDKMYTRRK